MLTVDTVIDTKEFAELCDAIELYAAACLLHHLTRRLAAVLAGCASSAPELEK